MDFPGKGLSLQAFLSERLYNLIVKAMKKGLHPETYRLVAFKDMSNETVFITRSCAEVASTNSTRDTRTAGNSFQRKRNKKSRDARLFFAT